jgi:superfamily II DNA or RNA helicase
MPLRPYQRECLDSLRDAYRKGRRRVLVSLPTGTGKTVVFAQFPRFFAMKKRLLVLAHREELIEQARQKLVAAAPELPVGVERAGQRASAEDRIVVASVPTLGRGDGKRLAGLERDDFYLIVVDEAHHAVAPSYRRIFDHFQLFVRESPRMLVGFTATPRRGDRRALGEVFEDIAYSRGLQEMIAGGWLCGVRGWRVRSSVSLDDVEVRHGDFVESQLARAVDVADRNALVVAAWRKLADARRTIVFCANVAHAQAVAAAFRDAGAAAEAVWGAMPPPDRRATLARLARGETSVVTNCNVLTEGFDEPSVSCVMMARPTRSRLLYAQMIGRGTRLHPGKPDLAVIDVVDATREHTLAGLNGLFDLPDGLDLGGAEALRVAERLKTIGERAPWVDVSRLARAADVEVAAERVDLFRFEPPDAIAGRTRLAWHEGPGGDWQLALPARERLMVRKNLLGSHDLVLASAAGERLLLRASTPEAAVERGDAFVLRERADALKLVAVDARWRDLEPTEAQLSELRGRRVPIPKRLTRGQASWMIAMLRARARR